MIDRSETKLDGSKVGSFWLFAYSSTSPPPTLVLGSWFVVLQPFRAVR